MIFLQFRRTCHGMLASLRCHCRGSPLFPYPCDYEHCSRSKPSFGFGGLEKNPRAEGVKMDEKIPELECPEVTQGWLDLGPSSEPKEPAKPPAPVESSLTELQQAHNKKWLELIRDRRTG